MVQHFLPFQYVTVAVFRAFWYFLYLLTIADSEIGKKKHEADLKQTRRDRLIVKKKILFVDTAGMERYGRLTRQHYHGSHVVLLVYDCDNSDSLKELKAFYKEARDNTNGAAMVLVRNKIDKNFQSVDIAETTNMICNHHTRDICKFELKAETSAKYNTGIEKLVNDIAEYLIKNVEPSNKRNDFKDRIRLEEHRQQTPPSKTSSSGCPC